LMPTMPALIRRVNSRATRPSLVKHATPLPYSWEFTRSTAVAKSGVMFFLERETGRPIYPVEERPVPQTDIPGETTWPTQPFPVKPPPLARLSITPDEVFKGEPEHEKFCRELVEKIGGIHNLGPYTPYSTKEFRIIFPGQQGGPNCHLSGTAGRTEFRRRRR